MVVFDGFATEINGIMNWQSAGEEDSLMGLAQQERLHDECFLGYGRMGYGRMAIDIQRLVKVGVVDASFERF